MRVPGTKPRSAQRQAVLALFETMDVITKFDVAPAIGLSPVTASNLLSAMAQDGVIARGPDAPGGEGRPNNPLRTFIRARKAGGFNPFLTMALRRKNNSELGIENSNGWA